MNRTLRTAALVVAILLLALAGPADAGIWQRLKGASSNLVGDLDLSVGTVLAVAAAEDNSGQLAVLVLDTSLQQRLACWALEAGDRGRLQADAPIGATFEVFTVLPASIHMGELECPIVSRWRGRAKGNPTRRDFLIAQRGPILAYALRGNPGVIRAFDLEAVLMPASHELRRVEQTMVEVGLLQVESAQVRVESAQPPPLVDSSLLSCRSTLRSIRSSIEALEETAALLPAQPGLAELYAAAGDAAIGIDGYFAAHPGVAGSR